MCCTHEKPVDERQQLLRIAESLEKVGKRLDCIERQLDIPHGGRRVSAVAHNTAASPRHNAKDNLTNLEEKSGEGSESKDDDDDDETTSSDTREKRDDLINPYWIEDKDLKRGEVDYLSGMELTFWKDLIEKYLKPIDSDKQKEARIAKALAELRDRCVFFFFMCNAIFVIIVFLMQLNKDALHLKWPFGIKTNITYNELTGDVYVSKEYLQLEPIGLVFVAFFALILIIQFIAMLFHRFGTLSHILASTELFTCGKDVDTINPEINVEKDGVRLIRKFQKLKNLDNDSDRGGPGDVSRRKTIHNLEKQKNSRKQVGTLDVAFEKKFKEILNSPDKQARILGGDHFQVTFEALKERRTNVLERRTSKAERKKSHMETLKGPILPLPPNGVAPTGGMNGNGPLVPNSAASRTRGKAPKPKVTSIDFENGQIYSPGSVSGGGVGGGVGVPPGQLNQGFINDDEIQLYNVHPNRRNSRDWRDPDIMGQADSSLRGSYDHLPNRRNNSQM
jgi:chitin synthase